MRGRSEEKLRKFDGLDEILIKEKVKRHPGTKLQQMNLTNDQIMSSFITDVFPLFYPPSLPFIETEENTLSVQVQQLSDRHLTDQELELNFLVIMGLLVKLVENDASNRSWLAAVSIVLPASEGLEEESHRDVISLLHSIFLTNQEAGDASEEGNTESWDDEAALLQEEKEVEKMIVQAYAVLLLAFLSTESNGVRDAIANCQTSTELHSIRVLNVYFVEALYSLRTRILSGRE
ncbi:wings apart-like protein 1 [Tripterygium wilfordii]|nr:wings apart-like protein 1 [Tripterygium wilfordii]